MACASIIRDASLKPSYLIDLDQWHHIDAINSFVNSSVLFDYSKKIDDLQQERQANLAPILDATALNFHETLINQ